MNIHLRIISVMPEFCFRRLTGGQHGAHSITRTDVERLARQFAESAKAAAAAGSLVAETAPAQLPAVDDYRDRVMKHIPADLVAIYLTLTGLLKMADPNKTPIQTLGWIIFGIVLVVSLPWQTQGREDQQVEASVDWSLCFLLLGDFSGRAVHHSLGVVVPASLWLHVAGPVHIPHPSFRGIGQRSRRWSNV
jgi:hypothetical protein